MATTSATDVVEREAVVRAPRPRSAPLGRRVDWIDGTTDRPGWKVRYANAGGSVRTQPLPADVEALLVPCWIATTVAPGVQAAASVPLLRAAHLVRTVIQRGAAPPLHPDSERALLQIDPVDGIVPNDLIAHVTANVLDCLRRMPLSNGGLDPALPFRDDALRQGAAAITAAAPLASRWTLPGAPRSTIARASGDDLRSPVRDGMLVCVPGEPVRMIDPEDLGDPDRLDALLVELAGIAASPSIAPTWSGITVEPGPIVAPMVWGPVQVHRLLMAIVEARVAGLLHGERWCIELDDPTGLAVQLIAPYLDLLAAADVLHTGAGIAPADIVIQTVHEVACYRRTTRFGYERIAGDWPRTTFVRIHLDCFSSPAEPLPTTYGLAHVVVRTASLPVRLLADRPPPVVLRVAEGHADGGVDSIDNVDLAGALTVLLQTVFAKPSFRDGQLEALIEVLAGRDCLALLPTNGGKSIIGQLAAICRPGSALVVDPLTSLMDDQIRAMGANGIDRVALIEADALPQTVDDALQAMRTGEALLLLVAPEQMRSALFRGALARATANMPISLTVVDEAHCVSEWSHDFRTTYVDFGAALRRGWNGGRIAAAPVLALTATASRVVQIDVMHQLGIALQTPNSLVRATSFDRPELSLEVHDCASNQTLSTLQSVLEAIPAKLGQPAEGFYDLRGPDTNSGLIFCPARTGWHWSTEQSIGVLDEVTDAAHAEYSSNLGEDGRDIAAAFADDDLVALATTKAYGMGTDKANVRWVVHNGLPTSIEAYYQEIGRAGRDGRRAHCALVLTEFDRHRNDLLMQADSIDDLRAVVDRPGGRIDNVISALHFHLSWFGGVEDEIGDVLAMIDSLQIDGAPGERSMMLGSGDDHESKRLDRALLRLIQLGVATDVVIDARDDGHRELSLRLLPISGDSVVDALAAFVKRSQPGRSDAVVTRARAQATGGGIRDAVESCVAELVTFVYGTIERARRRSLREMLFAARAAAAGRDLRRIVLDFLTEGDMGRALDNALAAHDRSVADWIATWDRVTTPHDAHGLRTASARLLQSYPTDPWLLVSRAIGELLDIDSGDVVLAESHLTEAVSAVVDHDAVDIEMMADVFDYVVARCGTATERPERAVAVLSAAARGGLPARRQLMLEQVLRSTMSDAGLAVVQLARQLRDALGALDVIDVFLKMEEAA